MRFKKHMRLGIVFGMIHFVHLACNNSQKPSSKKSKKFLQDYWKTTTSAELRRIITKVNYSKKS